MTRYARQYAAAVRPRRYSHEAFRHAVATHPADRTARGAYADWLEENGHPTAPGTLEALRHHPDPVVVTDRDGDTVARSAVDHHLDAADDRLRELGGFPDYAVYLDAARPHLEALRHALADAGDGRTVLLDESMARPRFVPPLFYGGRYGGIGMGADGDDDYEYGVGLPADPEAGPAVYLGWYPRARRRDYLSRFGHVAYLSPAAGLAAAAALPPAVAGRATAFLRDRLATGERT